MMFTRKRRTLPNSKKKRRWYILAFPLLIFIGSVGILLRMSSTPKLFISALPDGTIAMPAGDTTQQGIQTKFEQVGFTVDSIETASDSAYLVRLDTGATIVVNDSTPVEKISSLQALVTNLTMEGKRIDRLDIRFDKSVVLFKK